MFQGNLVAVGTHKGYVQIWDAAAGKKLSVLEGHTARVGEWTAGAGASRAELVPIPPGSSSPSSSSSSSSSSSPSVKSVPEQSQQTAPNCS